MAVAFSAVGPAGGGGSSWVSGNTFSWTHPGGGSDTALTVFVNVGLATTDTGWTLTADAAERIGCLPQTTIIGAVDTLVEGRVAEHLLAVLREALSNVARHAGHRGRRIGVVHRRFDIRDGGWAFQPV